MEYTKITLKLDEFSSIVGKYDISIIDYVTSAKTISTTSREDAIDRIDTLISNMLPNEERFNQHMSLTRLLDKMLILNFESLTIEKITE